MRAAAAVLAGVLTLGAGVAGCDADAESPQVVESMVTDAHPRPVFPYEPTAVAPAPVPSPCKNLLVLGDSLANETIRVLEDAYEEFGYCVSIVDAAANGGNTITAADEPTIDRLDEFLDRRDPDAVLFSFVGNVPLVQALPSAFAYLELIDRVRSEDVPVYVTEPPVSAWLCDPQDEWSRGHEIFRAWVIETLPRLRPDAYSPVPWSRVLTPGGSWSEFNDSLRFDDGPHRVRNTDCVHLRTNGGSDLGAEVAAREIVAATQGLWGGP